MNCDLPQNHSQTQPDVPCDLHKLPFEDGSADEILSVHVVEHFWRWEVEDVLKEWMRVLKPGGLMVLECPNLEEACRQFLANPKVLQADPDAKRSLWVFYGDPKWKDPLMVHRWGYTPWTLGHLMHTCGLVQIERHPAEFKQRDPRDMRMVGRKCL